MLINLMDPSLRIAAGHHLDLDTDIAKELARLGHDVCLYAHQDISSEARALVSAHVSLSPIFRISPYMEPVGADEDAAAEMAAFVRVANVLAEDLREVRTAALWIWPTLFHSQHYACVLANAAVPIKGCMMMEPTYLTSCGKVLWRYTLVEAGRKGMKFDLGVVEPALHSQYLPLTVDGRVQIFPFPYDRVHETGPRRTLSTVGFFGNQRDEKGVFLLGELIGKLVRHGFKVVVHDSSGGSQGTSSDSVRFVFGFVPDLSAEIISCDLVAVPYKSADYQHKGSGIVWSAVANGIPIVAPHGSAPAALVERSGAGKLFRDFSSEAVLQAILEARKDYARIADAAHTMGSNWMKQHGIRNFAKALLEVRA